MANAPQIFNVDAFETKKRVVIVDGVQHEIRTLSVQQFIDNLATAEHLQEEMKRGDVDLRLSKQVEESCEAIAQAIPTLAITRIKELPIEKQVALLDFIRGDLDPKHLGEKPAAAGETATGNEEGDPAKKPT